MTSVFIIISYLATYVLIIFAAVCFASGLFYLAELAEGYSMTTLKIIKGCNYFVLAVHIFLLIFDYDFRTNGKMALFCGICTHALYIPLVSTFPEFYLKNLNSILCIVFVLLQHICWWFYFALQPWKYNINNIIPFLFLVIWLLPLILCTTLTFDGENTLPNNNYGVTDLQQKSRNKYNCKDLLGLFRFGIKNNRNKRDL